MSDEEQHPFSDLLPEGTEAHSISRNEEAAERIEDAREQLENEHVPPSEAYKMLRKALGFLCLSEEEGGVEEGAKVMLAHAIASLENSPQVEPN